jgi:hypothetical protein
VESAAPVARIVSDPEGARVRIDGMDGEWTAPVELELPAGKYLAEVTLEGHSPLTHEFALVDGDSLSFQFLLLRHKPERPTPESVGLRFEPVIPLLPEESASTTLEKFITVAETFSVIPLGSGLWLKIADQDEGQADMLMATGFTLTVGSYLTGRWLSSRRLTKIRSQNERIREANSFASINNVRVDREIGQIYQSDMQNWEIEVLQRGRVIVEPNEQR